MNARFSWVDSGDKVVRPWTPDAQQGWLPCDFNYHGEVVRHAVKLLGEADLHFIFTWDVEVVPKTGNNVVVVLLGDEWARRPAYAGDVLAVFRTFTGKSFWPFIRRGSSMYLEKLVEGAKLVRNRIREARRRNRLNHLITPDNVFEIPLGTYALQDVPFVPWEKRELDIFFRGMLNNEVSYLRPSTVTPKNIARARMARSLEQVKASLPSAAIECGLYSADSTKTSAEAYSRDLMNSRIALSPRGSHVETFRTFEAAKFGCVVVTNPLPPSPHYRNHPFIIVQDWAELPSRLERLLADPPGLYKRHRDTLWWWRTTAAPEAVGQRMAETLSTLKPELTLSMASCNAASCSDKSCTASQYKWMRLVRAQIIEP